MPTRQEVAGNLYLTLEDLKQVPGVLGRIGRERLADYQAFGEVGVSQKREDRPGFYEALSHPGLSLIAEVKRASPSRGVIADLEPLDAARAYARAGASALSVLTEPRHFGGALDHLARIAGAIALPILRKDFTVHPKQLVEAADRGASAVLLIVALLGERTAAYLELARRMRLDALVEIHDESELELALIAGADMIGVNNRDLGTLQVDLANAPKLMRRARERGFAGLLVAESGYRHPEQLLELRGLADAVLVGSALAGSGNLEVATRRLLRA
jgi:indole-3-glycerol phosphate synthase